MHVRHEGGPLLVPGGDETDATVEKGIHDVEVLFAGNAEDSVDTLVLQAADEQVGGSHSVLLALASVSRVYSSKVPFRHDRVTSTSEIERGTRHD